MSAFRRNSASASQGHEFFTLWRAREQPLWPWPHLCECFLDKVVGRGLRRIDLIDDILRWIRSRTLEAIDISRFGFPYRLDNLSVALQKYCVLPGVHKKSSNEDDGFVGSVNGGNANCE